MVTPVDTGRIIASLGEWASEVEQRRLWLSDGRNGSEVSSFTEAREQLYTDTGLGHELDRNNPVFGEPIDGMLTKLDTLLAKIDVGRGPSEIIDDSRMSEVRLTAKDLLRLLQSATR